MAGIFRKKLIEKVKVLSETPLLYEGFVLTTTTIGTVIGSIDGAIYPKDSNNSSFNILASSVYGGFCGCVGGCFIGVLAPAVIPIATVGLIIGGVACGCKTLNEKIN